MSVRVDHKKRRINFIAAWFLFIIFIIGTGQPVHAEAKNVVMFPPTPTSTPSPCLSWDLAADFRVSPNQENPNRDSCNNPNVWQFMVGSGLTHDPLSYSLASYFTPNFNGAVDVNVWSGTSGFSWPFVGYNASSQPQLVSWLAHTINVHPSNNQLVIVAWKSGLNGYVSISGGVADADPACGSGIQWTIDRDAVTLASGSYVNGGSQTFSNGLNGAALSMVAVNVNSMLYVIVDPNGDDLCDTTRLNLVINMVNPLTPTQTPTPLPKPSRTPTSSCMFSACTPTRTPTRTVTPTSTATSTPTNTFVPGTPHSIGRGTCWASGPSWPGYTVPYRIDASIPTSWINSINSAANTWTNVTPSTFSFVNVSNTSYAVKLGTVSNYGVPAYTSYSYIGTTLTDIYTVFNDQRTFDTSIPPSATSFSVLNVMTHEFGHWLLLEDLNALCLQATMFTGISEGEINKITLEIPDKNGVNWQYP